MPHPLLDHAKPRPQVLDANGGFGGGLSVGWGGSFDSGSGSGIGGRPSGGIDAGASGGIDGRSADGIDAGASGGIDGRSADGIDVGSGGGSGRGFDVGSSGGIDGRSSGGFGGVRHGWRSPRRRRRAGAGPRSRGPAKPSGPGSLVSV
ncbi:hypothetical protein [Streptomyces sp. NBC_01615]|uniref:hypothetical protein n=1 Tax=Streptomyces sp. NBC_01615 TaxID=2975898 RepID=UPI00386AAEE9